MPTTLEHRPINHIDIVRDVKQSKYQPTAEFVLQDGLIEIEYQDGAHLENPGTYVWICEKGYGPDLHQHVIYIGEYGFTVKYRMHQHWSSWPRTTRSNQKEPDHKKQKGDTVKEWLEQGYTVKVYSKPAQIIHIPAPHPLTNMQTDVPDMLRIDNKSYEEASLLEAFLHYYDCRPLLNGTKGSKGTIISEGYDIGIDKQTPVLNS